MAGTSLFLLASYLADLQIASHWHALLMIPLSGVIGKLSGHVWNRLRLWRLLSSIVASYDQTTYR
jgi:hypothetical protein